VELKHGCSGISSASYGDIRELVKQNLLLRLSPRKSEHSSSKNCLASSHIPGENSNVGAIVERPGKVKFVPIWFPGSCKTRTPAASGLGCGSVTVIH